MDNNDKVIKRIDSRRGKRGKREVFEFSGGKALEHIDEYMNELRMTHEDLETYSASAKEAEVKAAASEQNAASSANAAAAAATEAQTAQTLASGYADEAQKSATSAKTSEDKAKKYAEKAAGSGSGNVTSFNGREGEIMPEDGDYTADMVGAASKEELDAKADKATTLAGYGITDGATKAEAVKSVTVDGKTLTVTKADGSTSTLTIDAFQHLPSVSDLDEATSAGMYKCDTTTANKPISAYGTCVVMTSDDGIASGHYLYQYYLPARTNAVFVRRSVNAESWTGWGRVAGYDQATTTSAGLMSAADKTKLDGVETGATKTVVDSALSSTSTNPVQNKAVKAALDDKADTAEMQTVADSVTAIEDKVGNSINLSFSPDGMVFSSSTEITSGDAVIDAFNKIGWRIGGMLSFTASGGTQTCEIADLTDYTLVDFFASIPNIAPSAISQSDTTLSVTFDAQASAFYVAVMVNHYIDATINDLD